MQEHEKVSKTNIRRWVRGWQVRWVSYLRWGEITGVSEGVVDARIDGVKSGVKKMR
jgi:hypothetical protein